MMPAATERDLRRMLIVGAGGFLSVGLALAVASYVLSRRQVDARIDGMFRFAATARQTLIIASARHAHAIAEQIASRSVLRDLLIDLEAGTITREVFQREGDATLRDA